MHSSLYGGRARIVYANDPAPRNLCIGLFAFHVGSDTYNYNTAHMRALYCHTRNVPYGLLFSELTAISRLNRDFVLHRVRCISIYTPLRCTKESTRR